MSSNKKQVTNNLSSCNFCSFCMKICPEDAIYVDVQKKEWKLKAKRCTKCKRCIKKCPAQCLRMQVQKEHKGLLFTPYQLGGITLKNRIVMSPMCMISCLKEDGHLTDFHTTHYVSRAVGQVGLIMLEATAVTPQGRIKTTDLGIWDDTFVDGYKMLNRMIHDQGSHVGVQLAHAGRKASFGQPIAPSSVVYDDSTYTPPTEMTKEEIQEVIQAFRDAAIRAKAADFDVIEIHAAHGYLIHTFLSPLTNKRTDEYGGSKVNQYRILSEIIEAVKSVFEGPILVRISAEEYTIDGYNTKDYLDYVIWMKEQGIVLVDVSTGGLTPQAPKAYPGYQVPYAARIKRKTGMPTGAVGIIVHGIQAEEILNKQEADLIFVGRELLRNPYFPIYAMKELGLKQEVPYQYERAVR